MCNRPPTHEIPDSPDLDLWAYQKGVILDFSRPGKPTDNAFIESFNGKFRAECLNTHWFMSLDCLCRVCCNAHCGATVTSRRTHNGNGPE